MKSKAIIVLLGILTFLLGGIAGWISQSLYQNYLSVKLIKASAPQPIDIVGDLAKELDLDARQTKSLRIIFEESRKRSIDVSQKMWPKYQALNKETEPKYQALNKEAEPQYQAIFKETEQAIKEILNEEQRARYEEFLKRFQPPPRPEVPGN